MNQQIFTVTHIAAEAAGKISEGSPAIIKPIIKVLTYLYTLLFSMGIKLLQLINRGPGDPFFKLKSELEAKWYSQSSHAALARLRTIYQVLRRNEKHVILGQFKILSYGRFDLPHYILVTDLLFSWELMHQNWMEAVQICDHVIESAPHFSDFSISIDNWIIKKAAILSKLKGTVAAQQFLMRHLNLERKDCPLKSYLYKLRNAS